MLISKECYGKSIPTSTLHKVQEAISSDKRVTSFYVIEIGFYPEISIPEAPRSQDFLLRKFF